MEKRNTDIKRDKKKMGHVTVGNGSWEFKAPSWLAIVLITAIFGLLGAWGTHITNLAVSHITKEDLSEYVLHDELLRTEIKIINSIHELERCFTSGPCANKGAE